MRRSLLRCRGPELAHRDVSLRGIDSVAIGGIADMPEALRAARCHAIDPLPPSAIQSSCVAVFLFDQLVRAQQDRCRHIGAKRLAVVILSTVSYFTDNCTGRSAGFSLLRMRST